MYRQITKQVEGVCQIEREKERDNDSKNEINVCEEDRYNKLLAFSGELTTS